MKKEQNVEKSKEPAENQSFSKASNVANYKNKQTNKNLDVDRSYSKSPVARRSPINKSPTFSKNDFSSLAKKPNKLQIPNKSGIKGSIFLSNKARKTDKQQKNLKNLDQLPYLSPRSKREPKTSLPKKNLIKKGSDSSYESKIYGVKETSTPVKQQEGFTFKDIKHLELKKESSVALPKVEN